MLDTTRSFINAYSDYIEDSDWEKLLNAAHDEACIKNRYVFELVRILEDTLDINLFEIQYKCFLDKFKYMLRAGHPPKGKGYYNDYGAIKLSVWLQSPWWTNLYGLNIPEAIGVLIDNFNVEETPDEGTLLWLE